MKCTRQHHFPAMIAQFEYMQNAREKNNSLKRNEGNNRLGCTCVDLDCIDGMSPILLMLLLLLLCMLSQIRRKASSTHCPSFGNDADERALWNGNNTIKSLTFELNTLKRNIIDYTETKNAGYLMLYVRVLMLCVSICVHVYNIVVH